MDDLLEVLEQKPKPGYTSTWLSGLVRKALKDRARKYKRTLQKEMALRIEHSLSNFEFIPDPEMDDSELESGD